MVEIKNDGDLVLYICAAVYLGLVIAAGTVAAALKRKALATGGEIEAHFGGSFSLPLVILTTFSSVFSGFTVTGVPEEAYNDGFTAQRWIGAIILIATSMLFFYPRLRRLATVRDYKSPNDFISDRFGSQRLRVLCAICGVIPMLIYLTAQMISVAAIVSGFTNDAVPKWLSMSVLAVIVLVMEWIGGMNSVVLTDAMQGGIMVLAFVAVPFFLGVRYAFLQDFAAPDCATLQYVLPADEASTEPAAPCPFAETANATAAALLGCVPSGCLAATRPELFEYPGWATQRSMLFFFINNLAFPLQPHIIQRAYIAKNDYTLQVTIGCLAIAGFLTQPPGVVVGLTKAAFENAWPGTTQAATAYTAVAKELLGFGGFEYAVVALMVCSSLAAIMSTADSVLLGASSLVAIDLYGGVLCPGASKRGIVNAGRVNSLVIAAAAVCLGNFLSVEQMGNIFTFQNGLMMQVMPAFAFGLYTQFSELSITCGISFGLLALITCVALGSRNLVEEYVPQVNLAVFVNFIIVGLVELLVRLRRWLGKKDFCTAAGPVTLPDIRAAMGLSSEPSKIVLAVMVLIVGAGIPWNFTALGIPWFRAEGEPVHLTQMGVPLWAAAQFVEFMVVGLLALLMVAFWKSSEPVKRGATLDGLKVVDDPGAKTSVQEVNNDPTYGEAAGGPDECEGGGLSPENVQLEDAILQPDQGIDGPASEEEVELEVEASETRDDIPDKDAPGAAAAAQGGSSSFGDGELQPRCFCGLGKRWTATVTSDAMGYKF